MHSSSFQIPANTVEFEEVIKKSRFITRLYPVQNSIEAKAFILQTKNEFKDARHHCSAFVAGSPDDSQSLGFSDDGEPSGTAGKPMLAVLQGSKLGYILAVTTRYSGGIKLGTGGLVKAYAGGVKQALTLLPLKTYIFKQQYQVTCSYQQVDQLLFWLNKYNGDVITSDYQSQVHININLPAMYKLDFELKLQDMRLQLTALAT